MVCHHGHRSYPALPFCGDLSRQCVHRQDDDNCGLIAISDHTKLFFRALLYKGAVKTTQIACCGSFWMQFRAHGLFTDLIAGRPPYEVSCCGNLQQSVEFKIAKLPTLTCRNWYTLVNEQPLRPLCWNHPPFYGKTSLGHRCPDFSLPWYQSPLCWLYNINNSLGSAGNDFNYLHHLNVDRKLEYPSMFTNQIQCGKVSQ